MAGEEKPDPIQEMLIIEDEAERVKVKDDVVLNTDPPEDKEKKPAKADEADDKRERNADGTFKGKEGDEQKEKKPEKKTDEHVPLAKYLEEKNTLKAQLTQQNLTLEEYRKKIDALEAKMAKQRGEDEAEEPDFMADPKKYVDEKVTATLKKIEEANKRLEETSKKTEETATKAQQEVQLQQFFQDLQGHEQRFIAQNPDYYEAIAHIRSVRAAQLKMFDPAITESDIMTILRQEETNLAVGLAQRGIDPVKTAYDLAHKFGYQKKAPQEKKPVIEQQKANDQLPPDQTLGGGAGAPDMNDGYDEKPDPFDSAFSSLARAGRRSA